MDLTHQNLTIRVMPLSELAPADYNPRTISKAALAGLSESLSRFGVVQPIVWNERTGCIVGGHQRVKALMAQGATDAPVTVVDLDETEERALNVALNNPHISGDFTDDLQGLLEEIQSADAELYEALMLDKLSLAIIEAEDGDEDIPEEPENPVSEPGDVWLLGEHRVICGDSTSADVVAAVLNGATPGQMVTDPPYGVEYDANWRNDAQRPDGSSYGAKAVGKVRNDDRADWREAWAIFPGDVAYVWHAGVYASTVAESLCACDFEIRAQVIWRKSRFPISRGHYHWQHEPLWYAVRKGRTSKWCGDRKQSTIWDINVETCDTGHSTQKPLECMMRPMRNHDFSEVYDPFLGSGSTLIAAERLGRTCYGVELNPAYVDIIVKRWEQVTGLDARRESDGQTFTEAHDGRE